MNDKPGCLTIIQRFFGIASQTPAENQMPTKERSPAEEQAPEEIYPYQPQRSLLTNTELSFYHVLTTTLNGELTTCVQVNLSSLIYSKAGSFQQNSIYRNKINRKSVDFVLCDPKTLKPMLVIELDDQTHQREDRQIRDAFIEMALEAAQIPFLSVRAKATYSPERLLPKIREKLNTYEKYPPHESLPGNKPD